MKKVILSMAIIAGMTAMTTVKAIDTVNAQPSVTVVMEDDGFADVKFEELNENVQAAVRVVSDSYDLTALKHNAEKQITKAVGVSKEDQSEKTFYFDNEGKETTLEEPAKEATETQTEEVK